MRYQLLFQRNDSNIKRYLLHRKDDLLLENIYETKIAKLYY